ncbi:Glycosyltransferase involved in cell wall bisynthesis [Cnuella takakiae]|uniref:Glycosyltransferase involved in cell wall bisynthesis n=1 Tax=Cnuella takakiae TaxID=1302690 RepID=A0A1M5E1X1_9BACT|nr:glycosyltransferase family 4 protein [Cnuella takakiae]OLY93799.1 hypothetical protein BUE76_19365 [Cnuella takakiae]SHF73195.1 Glycosyltransferase involved in cell wall bisynthesis [Cnuella takakiae]
MKEIIFVNSHPIQYFAPLYKYMNEQGLQTKVWYCTEGMLHGAVDKEFGVRVKWDIPLLDGYDYRFFKNYAARPSLSVGFFSLVNFGMLITLFRQPKSILVVHGYHFFTHLCILLLAQLAGHTVCLRFEVPNSQEQLKKSKKQKLRRMLLKHVVFPRVNYFLYIGKENHQLYKNYGIPEEQLVFCPYAVDNSRFLEAFERIAGQRLEIRSRFGIPNNAQVILFSGKYIDKKRPLDLMQAFSKLNHPNCWLIMIGEGELRIEIEQFILKHKVQNVVLTGFVNQSEIPAYYAIGDVFVMCSTIGETWGLSVNEAMNFDLPVIVSDLTGCSADLVEPGVNGYVFPTGNVEALTRTLRQVLIDKRLNWSTTSRQIIRRYDYSVIVKELKNLVRT